MCGSSLRCLGLLVFCLFGGVGSVLFTLVGCCVCVYTGVGGVATLGVVVAFMGGGNNIKGAAATIGITRTLAVRKGEMLLVSLSQREGTDFVVNCSSSRSGVFSTLTNGMSVPVCTRSRVRGLRCDPTNDVSVRTILLLRHVNERDGLGGLLSPVGRTCSCVLVSYPPSLNVVALGTLMTSSGLVVPVRLRPFTFLKADRVTGFFDSMGGRVGGRLRVLNCLGALCSDELDRAESVRRLLSGRIGGGGVFGDAVQGGITLSRTDGVRRAVFRCTPRSANTGGCGSFAGRVVRLAGWVGCKGGDECGWT